MRSFSGIRQHQLNWKIKSNCTHDTSTVTHISPPTLPLRENAEYTHHAFAYIWSVWRVRCVNETMEPNRRIERQLNVSANNLNMEIYRHRCKRQPRQRWRNVTFQLEPLALCVKRQKRTKKKQKNRSEHNIIWINENNLACETVYLCSNGVPFALSFSVSHIWPSMNWEKCVYEHVR